MKIDVKELSPQDLQIDIVVEAADYKALLTKELNKVQREQSFKGFRKGKTPMGFIKKVYGKKYKQDLLNEKSYNKLMEYVKEKNLTMMANPILLNTDLESVMNAKEELDANYSFMIGLEPQISLKGLGTDDIYDYANVSIDDAKIDEQMDRVRKERGERTNPTDNIQAEDQLNLTAVELDGDIVKKDGHETEFLLSIDMVIDDALKADLLTKKPGGNFRFDIYKLEKERTEEFVEKYLMKWDAEKTPQKPGAMYEATIDQIIRVIPAELNEEFITATFGPEVKTEADARAEMVKQMQQGYTPASDRMLVDAVINEVEEQNPIELPTQFLRELAKQQTSESAEEQDIFIESFEKSAKKRVLINKIIQHFEIRVEKEDMRKEVSAQLMQNFGGMQLPEEQMNGIIDNVLKNQQQQEQIMDKVLDKKLTIAIKGAVGLKTETISVDELLEKFDKHNAAQQMKHAEEHGQDHDHDHDHDHAH